MAVFVELLPMLGCKMLESKMFTFYFKKVSALIVLVLKTGQEKITSYIYQISIVGIQLFLFINPINLFNMWLSQCLISQITSHSLRPKTKSLGLSHHLNNNVNHNIFIIVAWKCLTLSLEQTIFLKVESLNFKA